MGKLIIEGDNKQLKIIAKRQRSRADKYNLKISLEDNKKGGAKLPLSNEPPKEPKLTDAQTADLIAKCETLEDLKKYEGIELKQVSGRAYKKRLNELKEAE